MTTSPACRSTSSHDSSTTRCQDFDPIPGHAFIGKLVALRTRAEASSRLQLIDAYVLRLPAKEANTTLKLVDAALPPQALAHLQHLRRVAKSDLFPQELRERLDPADTAAVLQERQSPDSSENGPPLQPPDGPSQSSPPLLYVLVCPTSFLNHATLSTILSTLSSSVSLSTTSIPSTPPSTQAEAVAWSAAHWPTVYKAHNPFGPQPVDLARAAARMEKGAGTWMALAKEAAQATCAENKGERFGAVIVGPDGGAEGAAAVAAAGDTRWIGCLGAQEREEGGNVMAHAAMRAIGMVARQRVALEKKTVTKAEVSHTSFFTQSNMSSTISQLPETSIPQPSIFFDAPLTPVEDTTMANSTLQGGGYLCTDLEIWLTHEPCVMCAMAILHSRFDRVVFAKRMHATGALTSEGKNCANVRGGTVAMDTIPTGQEAEGTRFATGLGYGLFWRPELNWKMLAWQWVEDFPSDAEEDVAGISNELVQT